MSIFYIGLSLPAFVAAEAALFAHVFRWSVARSAITAILANISSGAVLFFGWASSFTPFTGFAGTGLHGWQLHRWWVILTITIWLLFLTGSVLTKSAVFAISDRLAAPRQGYARTLRLIALVNLGLYAAMLPLWLCSERPHVEGMRLVDRSEWAPADDDAFIYETPEGELWIANIKGDRLAQLDARTSPDLRSAYNAKVGGPGIRSQTRDGTTAEIPPKPISMSIRTTVIDRPNGQAAGQTVSFGVRGSPGMSQFLDSWSPQVLPGGRYVLFSCSGEVLVLDVITRDAVRLFRGYFPVALASLQPPEPPADDSAPAH